VKLKYFQPSFDDLSQNEEKSRVRKIKIMAVKEPVNSERVVISKPEDVYNLKFLREELLLADREKLICLHLNVRNMVISYEVVAVGTLTEAPSHPREVFKGALLANADSVILCHNHPSGDPQPSEDDILFTKRLKEAGDILGISLLDHLIFGDNSFVSLRYRGFL
jgi:DNA repair protein RadC